MFADLVARFRSIVPGRGGRTLEEKRSLVRLRCSLRVHCVGKGGVLPAEVTDISPRGLRLRLPARLARGIPVRVDYVSPSYPFERDTVEAHVEWCRRERDGVFHAGLLLAEEEKERRDSWVHVILDELGFDPRKLFQRRRNVRAEGVIPGRLTADPGADFQGRMSVKVLNLGLGGALVQAPWKVPLGTPAVLSIGPWNRCRPVEVPARVRSVRLERVTRSSLLGLAFTDLEPVVVRRLGAVILALLRERSGVSRE